MVRPDSGGQHCIMWSEEYWSTGVEPGHCQTQTGFCNSLSLVSRDQRSSSVMSWGFTSWELPWHGDGAIVWLYLSGRKQLPILYDNNKIPPALMLSWGPLDLAVWDDPWWESSEDPSHFIASLHVELGGNYVSLQVNMLARVATRYHYNCMATKFSYCLVSCPLWHYKVA